jgi:hypothetical protein
MSVLMKSEALSGGCGMHMCRGAGVESSVAGE